jgi:tetratricopeptide (TPR) repeat protein
MAAKEQRLSRSRLGALLPALLASGCVMMPPTHTAPRPAGTPGSTAEEGAVSAPEPARTGPASGAASASATLLEQSRAERAAGSYAEAAASIERALRIEPDNAWLWLELGEVRLAAGDPGQAGELARRALSLADGNRSLVDSAERLLARAQTR